MSTSFKVTINGIDIKRTSKTKTYTHVVVCPPTLAGPYSYKWTCSGWCSRLDLAERLLASTKKKNPDAFIMEVGEEAQYEEAPISAAAAELVEAYHALRKELAGINKKRNNRSTEEERAEADARWRDAMDRKKEVVNAWKAEVAKPLSAKSEPKAKAIKANLEEEAIAEAKGMDAEEKKEAIRKFWKEEAGRMSATEGAREIEARYGIPKNTARGIQNRIFDAPQWREKRAAKKVCPACAREAYDDEQIEARFGWRKMWRGPKDNKVQVLRPQSRCHTCR